MSPPKLCQALKPLCETHQVAPWGQQAPLAPGQLRSVTAADERLAALPVKAARPSFVMHRDERFGRQRNQAARRPTVMPRAAPSEANRSWAGRQPSAMPVVAPPAPCKPADQRRRRGTGVDGRLEQAQAREQLRNQDCRQNEFVPAAKTSRHASRKPRVSEGLRVDSLINSAIFDE